MRSNWRRRALWTGRTRSKGSRWLPRRRASSLSRGQVLVLAAAAVAVAGLVVAELPEIRRELRLLRM